jgi:hypothetical protein
LAVAVGLCGGVAYAVLAGPLGLGAGLLVVSVAAGRFVGLAALAGASGSVGSRAIVACSVGVALAAVAGGETGAWLFARSEGGVLGPVDYVAQVHGPLALMDMSLAAAAAWWTAR